MSDTQNPHSEVSPEVAALCLRVLGSISDGVLVTDLHKRILFMNGKLAEIYGISPDDGRVLWHTKLGRGGNQGGVHFGMAAAQTTVFVPMADYDDDMLPVEEARPGLYAQPPVHVAGEDDTGNRRDCRRDAGVAVFLVAADVVRGARPQPLAGQGIERV